MSFKHPYVSHRRLRTFIAAFVVPFVAAAGLASSSCASPGLPARGYSLGSTGAGYEFQVLVDGVAAPTYQQGGDTYVLGQLGARYTLRVVNHTGRRVEAVVSVDGRDAIDGKAADVRHKRGYLVPAWGSVDIDGWRLSSAQAAAFRFSAVADSYAARTGNAREVGVIGVAVFPERYSPPRPVYTPPRYPYSVAPTTPWRRDDEQGRSAGGPSDSTAQGESLERKSAEPAGRPPSPSPSKAPPLARDKDGVGSSAAAAAAPRAEGQADSGGFAPRRRSGLGTEFGETVNSMIREVAFTRAHASQPAIVLGVRYNDREGLLALGIPVDGCCAGDDDLALRQTAIPFPVSDRRYAVPPPGWQQGCCVR